MTNVVPKGNAQVSVGRHGAALAGHLPFSEYDTHEPARGFHHGPVAKKTLLLAFVHDLVVRLDDVILRLGAAGLRTRTSASAGRRTTTRLASAGWA